MRVKKTQIENELFKVTNIKNQYKSSYLSLSFPPPPLPLILVNTFSDCVLVVMNLKCCMIISERAHGLTLMSYTPSLYQSATSCCLLVHIPHRLLVHGSISFRKMSYLSSSSNNFQTQECEMRTCSVLCLYITNAVCQSQTHK